MKGLTCAKSASAFVTLILSATAAVAAHGSSASPAVQGDCSIDRASSSLGFATTYDGEPIAGRFDKFSAQIEFAPDQVAGRFDVVIELASATTDLAERDEVLTGEDFLAAAATAQARYQADVFRRDGSGFIADGHLELKGVRIAVPLHFTWTPSATGEAVQLSGHATVPRLAFGVGTGDWADTATLPDTVEVTTDLHLADCLAGAAN